MSKEEFNLFARTPSETMDQIERSMKKSMVLYEDTEISKNTTCDVLKPKQLLWADVLFNRFEGKRYGDCVWRNAKH